MKVISNEDYYKLKCIEYFFKKGVIVCGNQCTEIQYHHLYFFPFKDINKIETDMNWKDLYENKEYHLEEFDNMWKWFNELKENK